jgi:peptide/nickel transport system substrate-binding protein
VGQTFDTVYGDMVPGTRNWQLASYEWWGYDPDYEPTGEEIFATGAGSNNGSYSNPQMDKLITETTTSSSLSVFATYATYAARQLPVIYLPSLYNTYAVKSNLRGVTFNPMGTFVPEYWYFTR